MFYQAGILFLTETVLNFYFILLTEANFLQKD